MLVFFVSVLCAVPLIRVDVIDLCAVCCAYLNGVGAIDCIWVSVGEG